MHSFIKISCWLLSFTVLFSCSVKVNTSNGTKTETTDKPIETSQSAEQPLNVILMIGDGMGLSQISGGMFRSDSPLYIEQFPIVGLHKTSSAAELITDSAAGATAFSIGERTYNGAIGVDANKQPKENIVETLSKQGFSSGLIATCRITHATPASFYAHQPNRNMGYEIAADLVDSPIDVFVGGGKDHFINRTDEEEGAVDNRNIIEELKSKDFSIVNSLDELNNATGKVGYFYADGHPESILNGRGDILPSAISPVIQQLKNLSKDGFFLMVEGSQIDWGGHANDSEYIITEMLDFDAAVGKALNFAQQDGNTLLIVTADHETGGYALRSKEGDYKEMEGSFTTGGHTATMVPVFAYGPGAELFQGIYENSSIYHKIREALQQ